VGVPEICRYRPKPQQLWFGSLQAGKYIAIDHSIAIPMATPKLIIEALNLGADLPESEWDPLLRDWVRAKLSSA
jgi:hypothetical protein